MKDKNFYSPYKLLKHLDRLIMLKEEGFSYPIFVDFNITNVCNNKCPLCVSFEDRNKSRDTTTVSFEDAKKVIKQLKEVDVKAVYLAGGGDPSCHPNLERIVRFIKNENIDVAICTNGYELSDRTIETIAECCSWMRISLDADSPKIYRKTHGMDEKAFHQVINNMSKLIKAREKFNSEIVLGASYLIGPHTVPGIYNAAKLCKKTGIDYIRFRPFFNSMGENKPFFDWMGDKIFEKGDIQMMLEEFRKCNDLNDEKFSATYPEDRLESVIKVEEVKYKECYSPHVIAAIDANLGLYPCCVLRYNKKYFLGDLKEKSFKEIWISEKRKNIHNIIDVAKDCPKPCQYDKHNEILNAVVKDIAHSNFL